MRPPEPSPPESSSPPTEIAAYYDSYSTWYEAERRHGYYAVINDLEFTALAPHLAAGRVLEIGSGTGLILERTAAISHRVVGIDLSSGMAGVTHRKGLTTVNASSTALPFRDASFAVVYSFKVLPHVPDIAQALREIRRVVEGDGRALLEFYNSRSLKALADRLRRNPKEVFNRYENPRRLRLLVEETGFELVRVHGIRIVTPVGRAYNLPILGGIFRTADRLLRDTWGARYGGYYVMELRPK